MRLIEVRGSPLAVDDPGEGVPFLWGHGLMSSRADEDATGLFAWPDRLPGWRVVRWDARGHGRSSAVAGEAAYRWDELALDLLGLADALGIERFAGGGASMGAATTLHAAVKAPARVTAMVLVIPPTAWETRATQGGLYRAAAEVVEGEGVARYVELAARLPLPEVLAPLGEQARSAPAVDEAVLPAVLRGAAASDLPHPDDLRRLDQPTLLLAWDTDPGHPVSTAEALAELLPGARLRVARRFEDLAGWPAAVASFLEELPGGTRPG
jgi:3-oxoadipate enol-lactonase